MHAIEMRLSSSGNDIKLNDCPSNEYAFSNYLHVHITGIIANYFQLYELQCTHFCKNNNINYVLKLMIIH